MRKILIFFLLSVQSVLAQTITLSGTLREAGSLESIPGAAVFAPDLQRGATANAYGFYSLQLPAGQPVRLRVSAVGYEPVEETIQAGLDLTYFSKT